MKEYAQELIEGKSKLVPYKSVGDVIVVLQAAKDFGIPISAAFQNLYAINGRASVGIHFIQARLLNAGVTYKIIKDFEPVYKYRARKVDGGGDFDAYEVANNPDMFKIVGIGAKLFENRVDEDRINVIKLIQPVDRETVIEFTRIKEQADGSHSIMTITETFKWADAVAADLAKRDVWQKYPKQMMYSRCFTNGAKKIGDDLILGLNEISEMCDLHHVDYDIVVTDGNAKPNFGGSDVIEDIEVD
jgi:hypothetical protein